jgi:hypothetical protein
VKRPADKVVAKKTPLRDMPVLKGPPIIIPEKNKLPSFVLNDIVAVIMLMLSCRHYLYTIIIIIMWYCIRTGI